MRTTILFHVFYFILQDLLVSANNGFIDNRLKYLRTRQKLPGSGQGAVGGDRFDFGETVIVINNIDEKEDVEFLKSVIVNSDNMEIIKSKLSQTVAYRSTMLKNDQLCYRIEFPYFFTNPDLVSRTSFWHLSFFFPTHAYTPITISRFFSTSTLALPKSMKTHSKFFGVLRRTL